MTNNNNNNMWSEVNDLIKEIVDEKSFSTEAITARPWLSLDDGMRGKIDIEVSGENNITEKATVNIDSIPAKTKIKQTGMKGRPATISTSEFIEVHSKSSNISEVVNAFEKLKGMEPSKAKLYVSMRANALRKKGNNLKMFPRGRKAKLKSPTM